MSHGLIGLWVIALGLAGAAMAPSATLAGLGPPLLVSQAAWPDQAMVYICPMHSDVHGSAGGKCRRCGMSLVPLVRGAADRNVLDLDVRPAALRAGQPATLRLIVRDGVSNGVVREFEVVHERSFHLFIVSHDLTYFSHVHPVLGRDGVLTLEFTPPATGAYQLFADFMPRGGTPQFLQRSLLTAGYRGPIVAARLDPDVEDKIQGGVRVHLQVSAGGPVAGRTETFRCLLTDARTERPITDLQPYLGAWGHALIVSEDLIDATHSHPASEFSTPGGPNIVFETRFSKPGLYRLWVQFQRAGDVIVASFTVPVSRAE